MITIGHCALKPPLVLLAKGDSAMLFILVGDIIRA